MAEVEKVVRGQHDIVSGLACNACNACKAPSEEDILWGPFSSSGVGLLYPVSGMMNSDKYIDVIHGNVVRDIQTAFPGGGGIFQQDLPAFLLTRTMAGL